LRGALAADLLLTQPVATVLYCLIRAGMVIDRAGKKLYVNLTGTDEVGIVDLDNGKLVAKWPLPDAHVAHAMVLDEPNRRLFIATRQPSPLPHHSTCPPLTHFILLAGPRRTDVAPGLEVSLRNIL
jgi:hypothetical protein